jgi:hypothetical protein
MTPESPEVLDVHAAEATDEIATFPELLQEDDPRERRVDLCPHLRVSDAGV